MKRLSSLKPFLFNAYYSWLVDNDITPHVLVDATVAHVKVPQEYVKDGSIMLSLLPNAIADFQLLARGIAFKARFSGKSEDIYIPYGAMEQLISFETGSAFPIGKALEQLDLSPESGDDDIYPDEGTIFTDPQFEVDDVPNAEEVNEKVSSEDTSEDAPNNEKKEEENNLDSKTNENNDQTQKADPGFSFVDE